MSFLKKIADVATEMGDAEGPKVSSEAYNLLLKALQVQGFHEAGTDADEFPEDERIFLDFKSHPFEVSPYRNPEDLLVYSTRTGKNFVRMSHVFFNPLVRKVIKSGKHTEWLEDG